jgi:hypothetical protein
MPNFPGDTNALPDPYVQVETISSGVSIPTGVRLAALMGEGSRRETLVASAVGNGNDGLNSSFSSTTGQDGRHFALSYAPIISNRTTLYKNGIPLVGTEGEIDGTAFSSDYDYEIDISTGHIELQAAALVDQGGSYYSAYALNTGDGTILSLSLVDVNAPTETWTIRCVSVRRDGYGDPIDGYARFIATGSISGTLLDGYGQNVVWQSNSTVISNTVLSFGIQEGSTPFVEGDRFTVQVKGGTLISGDSLVANYIADADINDPEFFTDLDSLTVKHGNVSLTNKLSLGAQLAFANGPPGVWACQCAPSVPRRVSYSLVESATGGSDLEDLEFALPLNVTPNIDTNINFFITNAVSGIETQIIPNKVAFYNASITADPASFTTEYTYSYTVILTDAVIKGNNDGVLTPTTGLEATLDSTAVNFNLDDLSATRRIRIFNATNAVNNGTFDIVSINEGVVTITGATFVAETAINFQIIDSADQSSQILFTEDLALGLGEDLRVTVVDTKDADFFDAGWINAYEALELIDVDIVVPLPSQTISVIFQNGASHVRSMSNIKNKKERVLFIGAISGLTPANVMGTEEASVEDVGVLEGIQGDDVTEILAGNIEDMANYGVQNSFANTYRVCYFYPDQIIVQIGADNTAIDGFYIAAAAAGYLSGVPNIAIPLTKKTLSGFSISRTKKYRPIVLEQLTASGITVLQPVTGGGKVIRGQTTTNSGFVEERELSVVFIRDRIAKNLRTAFEGFVGEAESPVFKAALTARAKAVLSSFIGSGLITAFKDLLVMQDSVDPTQWNITVKVQPVYPVNFIFIRVGIGLL